MMVFAGLVNQLNRLSVRQARLLVSATGDFAGAPATMHPNRPLHYKRAALGKRRWAPLRFQHLRAKAAKLCSAVAINLFELRSILPAPPDLAAASAGHRATGARAPPFA
jgi:hypothetical protein